MYKKNKGKKETQIHINIPPSIGGENLRNERIERMKKKLNSDQIEFYSGWAYGLLVVCVWVCVKCKKHFNKLIYKFFLVLFCIFFLFLFCYRKSRERKIGLSKK